LRRSRFMLMIMLMLMLRGINYHSSFSIFRTTT
jgi:hypothetical protein